MKLSCLHVSYRIALIKTLHPIPTLEFAIRFNVAETDLIKSLSYGQVAFQRDPRRICFSFFAQFLLLTPTDFPEFHEQLLQLAVSDLHTY